MHLAFCEILTTFFTFQPEHQRYSAFVDLAWSLWSVVSHGAVYVNFEDNPLLGRAVL